ncbi:MAG: energy transducer TonB [Bacteroidota bacterium]
MKRVLTFVMMNAMAFALFAGENEAPKATNYKEVIKEIEYPQVCREKGIEGTVVVLLKISETGEIMNYRFNAAPCKDLQKAVEKSLSKLTFTPATNEVGQAVVGKIALPVNFKLSI